MTTGRINQIAARVGFHAGIPRSRGGKATGRRVRETGRSSGGRNPSDEGGRCVAEDEKRREPPITLTFAERGPILPGRGPVSTGRSSLVYAH